ncbi:unnamed protein product [Ixodes pacificus]
MRTGSILFLVTMFCLISVSFCCDDMGFYREARRCKEKLEDNLRKTASTRSCCPYYQLTQCLSMAHRYTDCPKSFADQQLGIIRQENGLQQRHCSGGKELCAQ